MGEVKRQMGKLKTAKNVKMLKKSESQVFQKNIF